jgi:hypothetical protein
MWLLCVALLLARVARADVLCASNGGCGKGLGFYAPPGCEACACCAPCPAGAWCRNADPTHNLTECPVGHANPDAGQHLASACARCAAGSIAPTAGLAACAPCNASLYSVPGAGACCPAGALSGAGSTECTPCSPGSACPAGVGLPCAAGSFSSAAAATACAACAPGRYSPTQGADACLPCPEDHTSGAGASACTLCAAVRGAGWLLPHVARGCRLPRGGAPSPLFSPNLTHPPPLALPPHPCISAAGHVQRCGLRVLHCEQGLCHWLHSAGLCHCPGCGAPAGASVVLRRAHSSCAAPRGKGAPGRQRLYGPLILFASYLSPILFPPPSPRTSSLEPGSR